MDRRQEVRELLALTPEEVIERAGARLKVCADLDLLHLDFAERVVAEVKVAAEEGRPCRLILPVGPTGGYPYLRELVRSEGIDLSNCWFFFMDEYCGDTDEAVPATHPLSFKGIMKDLFFDQLDPSSGVRPDQVIFPDHENVGRLAGQIESVGGIDACFGGIGIHGHVAFNEPEPGVAETGPRQVDLNDFTITINAVRAAVGGNLECFPRSAYTLGMVQILSARRVVLYCRNGIEFDWANTVLRLALFGTPGDDYPVTHLRESGLNDNYLIVTDQHTLQSPAHLL